MNVKPLTTSVILSNELAEYLDQAILSIRRTSGISFNRSMLLRGIVAGVKDSPMEFSRCRSEKEVAGVLAFRLTALGQAKPSK